MTSLKIMKINLKLWLLCLSKASLSAYLYWGCHNKKQEWSNQHGTLIVQELSERITDRISHARDQPRFIGHWANRGYCLLEILMHAPTLKSCWSQRVAEDWTTTACKPLFWVPSAYIYIFPGYSVNLSAIESKENCYLLSFGILSSLWKPIGHEEWTEEWLSSA